MVTTTSVQDASPAGAYAHTVNRGWFSDANMPAEAKKNGCQDISTQLVYNMDIDVRRAGLRGGGGAARRGGAVRRGRGCAEVGNPPPTQSQATPSPGAWQGLCGSGVGVGGLCRRCRRGQALPTDLLGRARGCLRREQRASRAQAHPPISGSR